MERFADDEAALQRREPGEGEPVHFLPRSIVDQAPGVQRHVSGAPRHFDCGPA